MTTRQYLQYGSGWCAPQAWINFDASPTLYFERIPLLGKLYTKNKTRFPENVRHGDIVKGLPVAEKSCAAVYCSHVLEHLALIDLRQALLNTYRILEPGGIFRFVLPDLEHSIKKYNNDTSHEAALHFMRGTLLGREKRNRGLGAFFSEWLGNSGHLWMWDYKSIAHELRQAGFIEVRRAVRGDSNDRMFDQVEEQARWDDHLGVECKK